MKKTKGKTKSKKATKPVSKSTLVSRKPRSLCAKCGYRMVHLHSGNCPMCIVCSGCGEKMHSCNCIEGE